MSCEHVVQRAAANLPQSTTETLFTISGGRVLLLGMFGAVATAIQAQSNTAAVYLGSDENIIPFDGDINGATVGALLGIAESGSSSLVNHNAVRPFPISPVVMQSGAEIQLQCSASSTGQVAWTLWYRQLDPGAVVAAV